MLVKQEPLRKRSLHSNINSENLFIFNWHLHLGKCYFAVTIQQHPICFVIDLLMYESVHFASLFLAYGALLNSYSAWVVALFRH